MGLRWWVCAASMLVGCAYGGGRAGDDAGPRQQHDGGHVERDAYVPPVHDAGPLPSVDAAAELDAGPPPLCVGVDCSALDGVCVMGVCDPATGGCTRAPRPAGTSCDDGDACTESDQCASGACAGTPLDCSVLDGPCSAGVCDAASGGCVATPISEGASCDSDPSDCMDEACVAGSCTPAPRADCASCGASGTQYCSAGACGAPPTSIVYDFEAGLPSGWSVGGDAGWAIDTLRPHGGSMSAHSGAIAAYGTSSMSATITVAVAARLSFWLYTSSESGFDYLRVYVDGVQQGQWSGTTAWTQAALELSAGSHAIEWRYTKDGSLNIGDDRVWIDDVVITPTSPVPVEGFESGALPSGWTSSGSASWTIDTTTPRAGSYAARSGVITHSQSTSLFRTVTLSSAGNLRFWYRVSSESSYDYLRVYVDGVEKGSWSGTVSWAQASYPLTAGTHTVEWRYTKDGSVSSGSDAAWIDDVELGDPLPPSGSLCGP